MEVLSKLKVNIRLKGMAVFSSFRKRYLFENVPGK